MFNKKKNIIIFSSQLSNINFFLIDLVLSLNNSYCFYIICNNDIKPITYKNVTYINLNLKRKLSIFNDLIIFFKIFKVSRGIDPNLILSITPKVGLLISLVNFILKYQRIHFYTGQIWYNKSGIKRLFFKYIDKLTLSNSKFCFVDSKSQYFFLVKEGFNKNKLKLINNGSICGVDTSIFKKNSILKKNFRKKYNIKKDTITLLFMGRVTADKGFWNLIKLYKKLKSDNINFKLIIVGNDEELLLRKFKMKESKIYKDLIVIKHTNEPHKIIPSSDLFVLLSEREGFGLSVIQASSCSVPIIGTNIVGLKDSILNNKTGILINNLNHVNEYNKILKLFKNDKLRKMFGSNGRNYVEKNFEKSEVIKFLKKEFLSVLT